MILRAGLIATVAAYFAVMIGRFNLWLGVALGPVAAVVGVVLARRSSWRVVNEMSARADQWFRTVLELSPDYLMVLSEDGTVSYQSPSLERVLGHQVADVQELFGLTEGGLDTARRAVGSPDEFTEPFTITAPGADGPRTLEIRVRDERSNPVVNGVVVHARDVTPEVAMRAELVKLVNVDELTGLPNRRALVRAAGDALARASRLGHHAGLVILDLDGFKDVNDTLGHPCGDRLLEEIGRRFERQARAGETVARLGGDEFAVVLEGASVTQMRAAAERFIGSASMPVELDDQLISVGCSAGVSATDRAMDGEELFKQADIALYESKRNGRGSVTVFEPHHGDLFELEVRLAREIDQAFAREEFSLWFQPVMSLERRAPVGFEALMRWDSPTLGAVPPATFIPIAERSGTVVELGAWALREACRTLARLTVRDGGHLTVSVNVSPVQLSERLLDDVRHALQDSGLTPDRLILELTETAMMDHQRSGAEILHRLRGLGVSIAIDDFGTGYSSLGRLGSLPIDYVKIDRDLVTSAAASADGRSVLQAILRMGSALGLPIVAEGVETEAEESALDHDPMPLAQGYLYGRPVPAPELGPFVRPRVDAPVDS